MALTPQASAAASRDFVLAKNMWLDHDLVDPLRVLRRPGESYSDVIIRLAAEKNGSAE